MNVVLLWSPLKLLYREDVPIPMLNSIAHFSEKNSQMSHVGVTYSTSFITICEYMLILL